MNKILITGRLTKDPERKDTQSGTAITAFTVACPRAYVSKGKERETDFILCKAFNHTADFIASHYKKGSPIEVEGSLEVRRYQDSEGNNRSITEVNVSSVGFAPTQPKEQKNDFEEIPF